MSEASRAMEVSTGRLGFICPECQSWVSQCESRRAVVEHCAGGWHILHPVPRPTFRERWRRRFSFLSTAGVDSEMLRSLDRLAAAAKRAADASDPDA